jgi:hypothetical protein
MPTTVTRLYDDYFDARAIVAELEAIGVPQRDVSIIVNNSDRAHFKPVLSTQGGVTGAIVGAGIGALLGIVMSILAAFGVISVPGLGSIVAGGWLGAALFGAASGATAGAVVGGVVGAIRHAGVTQAEAQVYLEGVRRGGSMVSASVNGRLLTSAREVFARRASVDPVARGRRYREAGWTGFDETAPDFTPQDVARERDQQSPASKRE